MPEEIPSPPAEKPSGAGRASGGHVLLVCSHYARRWHTGGIRWRAMTRDLTRLGWTFDVIAIDPDAEGEPRRGAPFGPPEGVTLHLLPQRWWGQRLRERIGGLLGRSGPENSDGGGPNVGGGSPSRFASAANAFAELLRDRDWAARASRVAVDVARRRKPDVVVVSSPDHLPHRVGVAVARSAAIPYVADFRDPLFYGRGDDLASLDGPTRFLWRRTEDALLAAAAAAIDISEVASEAVRYDLVRLDHPGATLPRHYIPNGYDPLPAEPAVPDADVFRIAYTGWFYDFNPIDRVVAASGRFARRHGLGPESFRLEWVGTPPSHRGVPLEVLAERHGLAAMTTQTDRLGFAETDRVMQRAAVLTAFESVVAGGLCIPTKLYFYARMRADLLLLGRPDAALAREAGKIGQSVLPPEDDAAIDRRLDEAFARWRAGDYPGPIDVEGVFDSRCSAEKMDRLLRQVFSSR